MQHHVHTDGRTHTSGLFVVSLAAVSAHTTPVGSSSALTEESNYVFLLSFFVIDIKQTGHSELN